MSSAAAMEVPRPRRYRYGMSTPSARMGATCRRGPADADSAIAARAARQHGVVTRDQLRHDGLTDDVVDGRIARGSLRALHRGVYRMGPIVAPLAREMAACLACGPAAWVGHASAAVLWQLLPTGSGDVDIVVKRGYRRHAGIRLHRAPGLRADEVTRLNGIPVTRPGRTLLDLAGTASHREIERALAQAFAQRRTTREALGKLLDRWPRRRGARVLRTLLDARPALTRSEAEELFLGAVRRAKLPVPESNAHVAGHEVDFFWPVERLVAEIDGFAFHAEAEAFENDRRRDLVLTAHGMRVVRITWQQLTGEMEAVLARVAQALAWGGADRWRFAARRAGRRRAGVWRRMAGGAGVRAAPACGRRAAPRRVRVARPSLPAAACALNRLCAGESCTRGALRQLRARLTASGPATLHPRPARPVSGRMRSASPHDRGGTVSGPPAAACTLNRPGAGEPCTGAAPRPPRARLTAPAPVNPARPRPTPRAHPPRAHPPRARAPPPPPRAMAETAACLYRRDSFTDRGRDRCTGCS